MTMKCLYPTIFRGDVVKRGAILTVTDAEAEMDVVKRNFVKVDGGAAPVSAGAASAPAADPAPVGFVAGLTRDQAVMKLRQNGVRVNGRLSDENLKKLYETTFATVSEAADK